MQKVGIVDYLYLYIFFLQFIKLDTSQLNRNNGVLFSEDLNDDFEVWTLQCPDDVSKLFIFLVFKAVLCFQFKLLWLYMNENVLMNEHFLIYTIYIYYNLHLLYS